MLRPPHHDDPQRGQALVEFALTLPILLMLVFGIIDLARVMFAYTQVVDASRQAVRHGIVEGLTAPYNQYFQCEKIRDEARHLAGIVTVDTDVDVYYYVIPYETADGQPPDPDDPADAAFITWCDPTLRVADFADPVDFTLRDFVVAVRVNAEVKPLTPIIMPFANSIPLHYTATRNVIIQGADYTTLAEYPTQPPMPLSFTAQVHCNLGGWVDFFWLQPTGYTPSYAEIRNSLTASVQQKLDNVEPGILTANACYNCAQIGAVGGFGMYYMVNILELPYAPISSPPSPSVTLNCPDAQDGYLAACTGSCKGQIHGTVWEDTNINGTPDAGEGGFPHVPVTLVYWGADGVKGTGDDISIVATTHADGAYHFTHLFANGHRYTVTIDESTIETDAESALYHRDRTYPVDGDFPWNVVLTRTDDTVNSANFGYSAPTP